ncbi:Gryzun, putative trafficking through golgi-domain-containing protein [Bisporella sp. PMI_857]|nr:Gryzun, putative trafficking through golgi-domain-containing protein [Bisporella sp. PMI_857]
MDGYAPAYVAHNVPFLVVSGLGGSSKQSIDTEVPGFRITSDVPLIEDEDSQVLLRHFEDRDAEGLAWNGREHSGRNKFKIKAVGRDYILPPRSAQLHAPSARQPESRDISPMPRPVAHSPLSPLSPDSPLFPDGLIDAKWIEKHQDSVPSAYVSFYKFTSDPKLSTLQDNQLKTDVTNIKSVLSRSGYKTRLIVALLSEGSIIKSPDVEERLANIRKVTGLDSKTSLFFLPPRSSPVELEAFVETIISTVYPLSIEYYRDLSKHARRKRNRGVIPPPSSPPTAGTSQTLSGQGWNVRYDFKLGIFAEFRQEMDAAVRSYESGYEGLLTDVIDAIASWSPRWNEARLLADVFAFRILRCLLWNGNSTGAVRRWQSHRDRLKDFVDRRGKGSLTYGWAAWEARWATVMAEIIQKSALNDFSQQDIMPLYLHPEKSIAIGERLEPWEYMHHAGYWYRLASQHLVRRRALALAIPQEDRSRPVDPQTRSQSKGQLYDTYLCAEPYDEYPLPGHQGVDHALLIINSLASAIPEFKKRKQTRMAQELSILSATESMRREDWDTALRILRPLWHTMTFRKEGWWNAVEEIGWALRNTAAHAGDGTTVVAVDWELMNRNFVYRSKWHYDITKSLEGIQTIQSKPAVVLRHQDVHSFLTATYNFEHTEGKVGELCSSQLAITSTAFPASVPVVMSEVKVEFQGSWKPILIKHKNEDSSTHDGVKFSHHNVSLVEAPSETGKPTLTGDADLTFHPGETRVLEFSSLPREAGEASAISATFSIANDLFDLDFVQTFAEPARADVWWSGKTMKKRLLGAGGSSITILPKPPKIEVRFVGLQEQYYTNETIELQLEIINGEEVDSIANLEVWLLGDSVPNVTLKLASEVSEGDVDSDVNAQTGFAIGNIASTASSIVQMLIPPLSVPAVYDLTTKVSYRLVSDLETPVYKSGSMQLTVINPFEANYDFSPRIHPDPWPSYFSHDEVDEAESDTEIPKLHGLAQKWRLMSRYFSFATEDLIVEDLDLDVIETQGAIHCHSKRATVIPDGGVRVSPKSLDEAEFDIYTQKLSLDDRGTATLDVVLSVKWRRDIEGATINTTMLAVPRLLVSSSEPRVLAAVSYSATILSMVHFDITIENPSNHFLTFGLTMEPSDKFAFSGVKASTLQLTPLSRRTVTFQLLPFSRGDWIGPIRCVIRDRYFQKILKIAPTEGLKSDKEGLLVWVPPEEVEDSF